MSTEATASPATITPNVTTTFTITSLPRSASGVKTLQRLMRLEPRVQRGLDKLSARRAREDNVRNPRGGRMWTSRVRATKLVVPTVGAAFTIRVTPQLVPDIQSVAKHLSA